MKSSRKAVSHDETRQTAPCGESVEKAHFNEHVAGCHVCQERLQEQKRSTPPVFGLTDAVLAKHIEKCHRCQIGCHK